MEVEVSIISNARSNIFVNEALERQKTEDAMTWKNTHIREFDVHKLRRSGTDPGLEIADDRCRRL